MTTENGTTYREAKSFISNVYKKWGGDQEIDPKQFYLQPAASSRTIKYIAANPASRTPLSSETEIPCNRLNSAIRGLSIAVA